MPDDANAACSFGIDDLQIQMTQFCEDIHMLFQWCFDFLESLGPCAVSRRPELGNNAQSCPELCHVGQRPSKPKNRWSLHQKGPCKKSLS